MSISTIGLLALFALLALRFPIALSMILVGVVGMIAATMNRFLGLGMDASFAWDRGVRAAMSNLSGETFGAVPNYNLLVILFLCSWEISSASPACRETFSTRLML